MSVKTPLSSTPLSNIRVVEFAGLAPGPFCGLFLADWGASVIRIDRSDQEILPDLLARGKRSIAVNLKVREGVQLAKKLIAKADVLIDPFRHGVLERLGLGPDVFLGKNGLNRKLVYTRIVGFSRNGHHKDMAGHDLNYLAISGVLSMMPHASADGRPSFPINLLADFAGGGLMAASGVLLALLDRHKSGLGQVVETDMVSGARYVSSFPLIHQAVRSPFFSNPAGANSLDGGAPYYGVYRCKDGGWFTVGALEPQFYAAFLKDFIGALPTEFNVSSLEHGSFWKPTPQMQFDRTQWVDMRAFFEAGFLTRTRDEWTKIFDGKDACAVPVLTPVEAMAHSTPSTLIPHPHPRLLRTPAPASVPGSKPARTLDLTAAEAIVQIRPGIHTREILRELGVAKEEQQRLLEEGVVAIPRVGKAGAKL